MTLYISFAHCLLAIVGWVACGAPPPPEVPKGIEVGQRPVALTPVYLTVSVGTIRVDFGSECTDATQPCV
jgi:hypothetical protein